MKRSPRPLMRTPPSPRTPSVIRIADIADAGGVELEELHVFQRDAPPQREDAAVAGLGIGVGRDLPQPSEPAGGDDDRLGMEDLDLTAVDFNGYNATSAALGVTQQV